jgi:hypothetical protein
LLTLREVIPVVQVYLTRGLATASQLFPSRDDTAFTDTESHCLHAALQVQQQVPVQGQEAAALLLAVLRRNKPRELAVAA